MTSRNNKNWSQIETVFPYFFFFYDDKINAHSIAGTGAQIWKCTCAELSKSDWRLEGHWTQMVYSLPSLEYPSPCQLLYPPTPTGTCQQQAFTP